MRKFLDAVSLMEGVTFHPAVLKIEDGQNYIMWPDGTTEDIEIECRGCEGEGGDCEYCSGTGVERDTKYNLPEFRTSNHGLQTVLDILGMEFDYSGWIPPERLPELRRQLIRMLNTDTSAHEYEADKVQHTSIDREGEIPAIRRGPTIYTAGIDSGMIDSMIHRMLEIIEYSQKGGYGLSWS